MSNNSRFFFVLASTAVAIGLGNIWLYPYFSFKSTVLFFIPYLIALIVLGVPLLMLEFSIGQYFNKNVVDLFASIRKWFSSIGWLMLFNAFIVMSFYAVVLSWHIIYFFVSFGLQWKNDAKAYFLKNVLQASEGFRNFTQFSLPVFIALIIAWLVIFFYVMKGFESIKKWFLISFSLLVLLMFFFLFYSLTLDNALGGVYSFLRPRLSDLINFDIWTNSFSLAVLSLGLSFGIMPAFAKKTNEGFIVGGSFITALFKVLISLATMLILFGILGFLSAKQGIGLDKFSFLNFDSSFTILAQALPFFYKPTLLSILFFAFFSIFFILGTASLAYAVSHVLAHKLNTKHVNASIIVVGFGFLFGLVFVIKPGFYIMDIANHFIYYNILIAILLEVLAIGWFFDIEKILHHINQNSILKIGKIWKFAIKYLVPLILLLLLFFQIKSDYLLNYGNYPLWAILVFGIGIVVMPIVAAYLMPQKLLDK